MLNKRTVQYVGKNIILTPSSGTYKKVLYWMHGLGDSSQGFLPIFESTSCPLTDDYKVVLLNAPQASVSINDGMYMNSWYDIYKDGGSNVDEAYKNADTVLKICINEEKQSKLSFSDFVIGGFSQGAAMSLLIGLTTKYNFGGLIACSGYLFPTLELDSTKKTPILITHGSDDEVIPESKAKSSYEALDKVGLPYEYHSFYGGHTIDESVLENIYDFIMKIDN